MSADQKLLIRHARAEDLTALRSILLQTFESTWRPNITPQAVAAFRQDDRPGAYVRVRGLQFWVPDQQSDLLGFIDWERDFVNALHVRPAHARTGVGARLMALAEQAVAGAGHRRLRLETDTFNLRSRAFYASRGYLEIDRRPDEEWSSGLTTLLLEKRFD